VIQPKSDDRTLPAEFCGRVRAAHSEATVFCLALQPNQSGPVVPLRPPVR